MANLLSYALTDVASVKESLGMSSGDHSKDNLIIRKINQATLVIESFCNLPRDHHFMEDTYTNETYDGNVSSQLVLRMRPVSTVSSFQYRDSPESDASFTDVDSEFYFTDLKAGIIKGLFTQNRWWEGYRVTYTAGYATIPDDLAEACVMLACFWVENSVSGVAVKRKTEGQRSIEYFDSASNSESIIESLGLDDILSRYVFYAV